MEPTPSPQMPVFRFLVTVGLQLALAVAAFAFIAPTMFAAERVNWSGILLWTLALGVPMSLFEYLYHRYLLHSAVLPFLGSMHRAHAKHHSLTYVRAPVRADQPAMLVPVETTYPIGTPEQTESMMFPAYATTIFLGIFLTALGLPLKLAFPAQPILLATMAAVTLYVLAYELWHAVTHLPYELFWQPMIAGRYTRRLARRAYAFHLMHHWRPTCNLAVVGLWGVAVWDHAFRTCHRPVNLPVREAEVNFGDAKLAGPIWPITMLDGWKAGCHRRARQIEAFFFRVFFPRRSTRSI